MDIVIQPIEQTSYSYEDVASFLHTVFQERLDQGLSFTTSRMSSEDFRLRGETGIVLVAFDPQNHQLLGTGMTHFRKDADGSLYADEEHKGVLPNMKRRGIGSLLERELQHIAQEKGALFIISDTAVRAKSSILFHLKNGFFKWKLTSYPSTSYYSYVFRKQLHPDRKWDNPIYRKLFFLHSCIKTLIEKKRDGSNRKVFRLVKHQ